MMEPTSPAPEDETPNQRAARLRRERRNAKIQTQGSDRLSKITSMGGRQIPAEDTSSSSPVRQEPAPFQSSTPPSRPHPPSVADDPDEVDISTIRSQPQMYNDASLQQQQELLRQMLRAPQPGTGGPDGAYAPGGMPDDPMMRMMQQMMGGGAGGGTGGMPPGFADLFGGAGASPAEAAAASNSADYVWRIVHGLFAFVLAAYAASAVAFTGSVAAVSREQADEVNRGLSPRLFWMFTTLEIVLQSTRYFVDGGRLPKSGILGMMGQFLPEPYAGYVRLLSRYSIIYTTVVSDAMVVVFVLGIVAWLRGKTG